jgi:hypothetical protein
MSFQRAAVNCERCYRLSSPLGDDEKAEDDGKIPSREYQMHVARNEAMKALEDAQRSCRESVRDLGVSLDQTNNGVAAGALVACQSCDYSTPLISDVFNEVVSATKE